MEILKRILDVIDRVNRIIGGSVAMLILVLTALITVEVVMRYALHAPTVWSGELSSLLFATYVLLGGGYALYKGDHVKMDILYTRLSDKGKAIIDLIAFPLVILYCWILMVEGWSMVSEAIETNRTFSTDWAPLMWPWLLALPLGALLLGLQVISNVLRQLINAFGKDSNEGETA